MLSGWLTDYVEHLRVERGLADRTTRSYQAELRRWAAWAREGDVDPLRPTVDQLRDFLRHLEASGLSPRSRARSLSSLRGFLRYLLARDRIDSDPTELLRVREGRRRLPRALSPEEVDRLLEAPDVATAEGVRDRAMLEVAYGCGLRVSELVGLRLGDVDREEGLVRVRGKGGKHRLVPIGDEAADWVGRYLREVRGGLGPRPSEVGMFLGRRGRPLTQQRLGILRSRRLDERRSPALTSVSGEGELRDHEQAAADLLDRTVHPPLVIGEDAQRQQPPRDVLDVVIAITLQRAHQRQQAGFDRPHRSAIDLDGGAADSLDDADHAEPPCRGGRPSRGPGSAGARR